MVGEPTGKTLKPRLDLGQKQSEVSKEVKEKEKSQEWTSLSNE